MSTLKVDTINTRTGSGNITFSRPTVLQAGDIVEADIADNAITLAKMAGGTDGNIISYDASGDPVAVATGSSGQVLTSAGAGAPPTFASGGVSGLTNSSNTTWMTVSADEEVNMPLQPLFAGRITTQNNVTGTGNYYTVLWQTELFDIGTNFASPTFTAPITGHYLVCCAIGYNNSTAAQDQTLSNVVTSNRSMGVSQDRTNDMLGGNTMVNTLITDMDAADTLHITFRVAGESSDVVDLNPGYTYLTIMLVA